MKCRWCTAGETDCEMCDGTGEVTAPPFASFFPTPGSVLSELETARFAEYWCDGRRDETLGQFIDRVAAYAKFKEVARPFYHVCTGANLLSILEHGLVPTIGERSVQVENTPAVFLFSTRLACEEAVQNWLGELFDEKDELFVLEVILPQDVTLKSDVEYEVKTASPIPADCIVNVLDESLQPVDFHNTVSRLRSEKDPKSESVRPRQKKS